MGQLVGSRRIGSGAAAAILMSVSAVGAQPVLKWRLVEEWRVGGEADGPYSLGDVRGLGVLPNGGIVVLDARDQQVHLLDAKGKVIRSVGRKGSGPGEFREANGLVVGPGGRVIVNDPANGRFTVLAPNGDVVRSAPIPNTGFGPRWDAYVNASGLLDEELFIFDQKAGTSVTGRRVWSSDFARADTVVDGCQKETAPDFKGVFLLKNARGSTMMSIPFTLPSGPASVERSGERWSGVSPTYSRIERFVKGECTPSLTVQVPGKRVAVPAKERDAEIARVRGVAKRYGAADPDFGLIPAEYPAANGLYVDDGRRLWVARRTSATAHAFSVFASDGKEIADVDTPVEFVPRRPIVITTDRVLGTIQDGDGVTYLVAMKIERGGRR